MSLRWQKEHMYIYHLEVRKAGRENSSYLFPIKLKECVGWPNSLIL
jgi:hypothetical protein